MHACAITTIYHFEMDKSTLTATRTHLHPDGDTQSVLTGWTRLAISSRTSFAESEHKCIAVEVAEAAWTVTRASVRRLFSCYGVAVGRGGDGDEVSVIKVSMSR